MAGHGPGEGDTLGIHPVVRVKVVLGGHGDGEAGRVDEGGGAGVALEDGVGVATDGWSVGQVVVDKLEVTGILGTMASVIM